MTTKTLLLFTVALMIGCAAGAVGSQLVIPAARAGTTPQRWEYVCIESGDDVMQLTAVANRAGQQGWELTAASISDGGTSVTNDAFWCFKRPAY